MPIFEHGKNIRADSVSDRQDSADDVLEADLLGRTILIDPKAAQIGGAWQQKDANGKPCAWDPDTVAFFLDRCTARDAPFIIDIGANTGLFCLLPVLCPAVSGFAFEPNPEVYKILKRNLTLNNIDGKIRTFPLALSDKTESRLLKIPLSGCDSGLACLGTPMRFARFREITVPVDTLDNILARKRVSRIDLIKIDTEGCELFVLRGARETLLRFRPDILLEYNESNTLQFGYKPEETARLLAEYGYSGIRVGMDDMFFSISSADFRRNQCSLTC
jgi:FkbM family methyltransferase